MLPASGISPRALQCSAARLLAYRCEVRISKRTFARPQRLACYQTAAAGSEFLPYLFDSATRCPSARSAPISIPGLSREPPGTSTTETRCFQVPRHSSLPRWTVAPLQDCHPSGSMHPTPLADRKLTANNARSSFAPHWWPYKVSTPADHRSGSATSLSARCSVNLLEPSVVCDDSVSGSREKRRRPVLLHGFYFPCNQ